MPLGTSLFLITVGAILDFAVSKTTVAGVDIRTVGLILLLVGILALILSLLYMFVLSDRGPVDRERTVARDRRDIY